MGQSTWDSASYLSLVNTHHRAETFSCLFLLSVIAANQSTIIKQSLQTLSRGLFSHLPFGLPRPVKKRASKCRGTTKALPAPRFLGLLELWTDGCPSLWSERPST